MNDTPLTAGRPLRLIVIHCSATPSGKWLGGAPGKGLPPTTVIDGWHAARGFKRGSAAAKFNSHLPSIGYHYVVDLDGTVHTGRALSEVGAHVAGHNAESIGICLVGGAEREARYTVRQWDALASLLCGLAQDLKFPLKPAGYQRHGVCGHRDLSPDRNGDGRVQAVEWIKTCPGFDVSAWLARNMLPLPEQICEVPQ